MTDSPRGRGRSRDRQHHGRLQRGPRRQQRLRLGRPPAPFRRLRSARAPGRARLRRGIRSGRSTSSATARYPSPAASRRWTTASQIPRGAYGGELLALRRGSYPAGPGQVAVTDGVAESLRLEIGSTLALDGRRRTVVGIVENPRKLSDEFALVSPSSASPDRVDVLVDASAGSTSIDSFFQSRRPRPAPARPSRAPWFGKRRRRGGFSGPSSPLVSRGKSTPRRWTLGIGSLLVATPATARAPRNRPHHGRSERGLPGRPRPSPPTSSSS